MSKKTIVWAYLGIVLYTIGPFLCVALASSIASANGSALNEGGAHPCVVWGCDIGDLLYCMFVIGWLGIVTIPTGALGVLGLTIALFVQKSRGPKDGKERKTESLAVFSIVFSATSVIIGPFGALPGIGCGYAAKKRIEKNPELTGKGLAYVGMLLGCLGMLVYIVLMLRKHR